MIIQIIASVGFTYHIIGIDFVHKSCMLS